MIRRRRLVPVVMGLGLAGSLAAAQEPQAIPLWSGTAPGSQGKTDSELVRLTDLGEHIIIRDANPPAVALWPELLLAWLAGRGVLGQ